MRQDPAKVANGARDESAFSIVEVIVAFFLLVLAVLATFQVIDSSTRTTFRAEESQTMLNIAQREVERLRDLDYRQLALTTPPSGISDPADPRSRVAGTGFDLGDGAPPAQMVLNGGPLDGGGQISGGTVDPGPTPFTSGDISGKIYRFVVWRDDPNCGSAEFCNGTQDLKRVVVAVKLNEVPISNVRPYEEVHTDFTDPDVSGLKVNPPPESGVVTGQQFWLTDTPCSSAVEEPPRDPPSDHATHGTLGSCTDDEKPDSLLISPPPPDPAPGDPDIPARFDYATDLEPCQPSPSDPPSGCEPGDKGLQLLRPGANGCAFNPSGTDPQHHLAHRWVTKPMPESFTMTGKATLELYTKTIDDVLSDGRICVFVYRLSPVGQSFPVVNLDHPPDDYFTYSSSPWPTGSWKQILLKMNFPETTLAAGDRLGIAITLDREGTSNDVLEFSYDHPDDKTRLEVLTTTPLN
jgi:hypothetical protein